MSYARRKANPLPSQQKTEYSTRCPANTHHSSSKHPKALTATMPPVMFLRTCAVRRRRRSTPFRHPHHRPPPFFLMQACGRFHLTNTPPFKTLRAFPLCFWFFCNFLVPLPPCAVELQPVALNVRGFRRICRCRGSALGFRPDDRDSTSNSSSTSRSGGGAVPTDRTARTVDAVGVVVVEGRSGQGLDSQRECRC